MTPIHKAVKWLNDRCIGHRRYNCFPVVRRHPNGFAWHSAYVFKLERPGKPSVWYLLNMRINATDKPGTIKRICLY